MKNVENILEKSRITDEDVKVLRENGYDVITRSWECCYASIDSPYIAHIYKGDEEVATTKW